MNTRFIAEISSNHNQSLNRINKLIDTAAELGCWAVKFQLFKSHLLFAPEFKKKIEMMKAWELPTEFLKHIKKRCLDNNLKFICTPFDLNAVQILKPYIDYYKIGSYELMWNQLVKEIIDTKTPWIFSTGMTTTASEIVHPILSGKINDNPPYAVLHCNSNYPAKPEQCNLSKITDIRKISRFIDVGWSDHTRNPDVILTAIGLGAKMIEFHFDLEDKKGFESSVGHCWTPSEIKRLINRIEWYESNNTPYPARKDWIYSRVTGEIEPSKWRTDPEDGMRPLKKYREELLS
jgi:N-acetylneuraminate synthase